MQTMKYLKYLFLSLYFFFLVHCYSDSIETKKDSNDQTTSVQQNKVTDSSSNKADNKNSLSNSSPTKPTQCKGHISELTINQCTSQNVSWLLQADTTDAYVQITENQVIWLRGVWNDGEWYGDIWQDGAWKDGHWRGGIWQDGVWENGTWYQGTWNRGTWKNGTWYQGTWNSGQWNAGYWRNGVWNDGDWASGTWGRGTWMAGIWKNGHWRGGTWQDGVWENGTWYQGTWNRGTWLDGTWWKGIWNGGIWEKGKIEWWDPERNTFMWKVVYQPPKDNP